MFQFVVAAATAAALTSARRLRVWLEQIELMSKLGLPWALEANRQCGQANNNSKPL